MSTSSQSPFSSLLSPQEPLIYFLYLYICQFWAFHIMESRNIWSFVTWLLSLWIVFRAMHVVACFSVTYLCTAECYSITWASHPHVSICQLIRQLQLSHLQTIMNNGAGGIHVLSFIWMYLSSFLKDTYLQVEMLHHRITLC